MFAAVSMQSLQRVRQTKVSAGRKSTSYILRLLQFMIEEPITLSVALLRST